MQAHLNSTANMKICLTHSFAMCLEIC